MTFAPKLFGFFVILLIGYFIAKALSKGANALLERIGFDGLVERGAISRTRYAASFGTGAPTSDLSA